MSRRLEIGALVALCFFLPLYEAPKSIFWLLYVVVWVANRARSRDLGGPWDVWDTLIAAWMLSPFVIAPFAGIGGGDEWRDAVDVLRCASVLWLVKRSRFDERELRWVLGALVASALIGVVLAYRHWIEHVNSLQLNSVGHVNHTAIYLAIMVSLCAAWALASRRMWALGATAFLLLPLFLAASRAAVLVGLGSLIVLAAVHWRRSRGAFAFTLAVVVACVATAWLGSAEVVRKQEAFTEQRDVLARRGQVWDLGLIAWRQFPWAGVGLGNYSRIRREQFDAWVAAQGHREPRQFYQYGHGHSLYVNTLAERGVVGTLPVLALMTMWLVALARRRPAPAAPEREWLLWGGAAGAWMVTAGVGLVNTTLHSEHGLLAALLLGAWLAKRPGR